MIQTRHDRQRGCGWRKEGGLYLVSPGLAAPCAALPIPIGRCPTCGNGIKPARGWTWIDAGALLAPAVALCPGPAARNPDRLGAPPSCARCPMQQISGRHGLLWVGGQFYATAEEFTREAAQLGVSRRITQVPKDLVIGVTWVFVGHRHAIPPRAPAMVPADPSEQQVEAPWTPGIFHAFRPSAVEYVVRGNETDEEIERLEKRGITPVRIERQTEQPEFAPTEATP